MDDSPEMWITLAPREVTDALWAKTKPWTLSVQQKIACETTMLFWRCPKLNCLSLESLDTTISQQELSSILEEHYPTFQLQEIRFMDPRERLINTLAVRFLLKPLAHLRHITLYRLHEYIVNTLVTCCENLESFRQINDELTYNPLLDTDNTLLYLLQGCPKLRVIDAIQHRIDAQALVESPPWVCHNLEVFRTQIIGVFRLEESGRSILHQLLSTEMLLGNLFLTEQEKHAMKMNRETLVQQQQVHARLSVLTRLKVLEIGVRRSKFNYYTGQMDTYSDTLEWTLRSGLDQLSPLKELEVIGFDGCNHETDRQEIDWMVANWPRLRAIRGLQSTCPWVLLTEQRKTNLRTYIQQIKPGIELLNSTQN
ncbi:hypothetical protein FBU30_005497 [Linnemannia zychae]|nr:hypothetical protein FBU30_005497 [Linnemannia zychae]